MNEQVLSRLSGLRHKQVLDVLRRLGGGTVGFNYAKFNKDELCQFAAEQYNADEVSSAILDALSKGNAKPAKPTMQVLQANTAPEVSNVVALPVKVDYSHIRPVRKAMASEVFGVTMESDIEVEVWNDPDAPDVDPLWVWDARLLHRVLTAMQRGAPVWCNGEKGTGKTQFAQQMAARLGRHCSVIQFDRYTERHEIIGSRGMQSASTVWEDGALAKACRRPGCIILLDEITLGQPGLIAILNTVLDRASKGFRIAETGEFVVKAQGVSFLAADNTCGTGDPTGRYIGTNEFNQATLDRFSRFVTFTFLPPEVETQVITSKTGADDALAKRIVDLLAVCRGKVNEGELVDPPSLRQAIAFAEAVLDNIPADEAFEMTVASKTVAECREQLRQLFIATWV
jgi:MoxR-like ATPase